MSGTGSLTVSVKLFGAFRDAAGAEAFRRELPAGSDVDALWGSLCTEWPGLAAARTARLSAVNLDYVDGDHALAGGDEVAFFPPVTGG